MRLNLYPSTTKVGQLFGEKYTKMFEELLQSRIAIKNKDFDTARKLLDGKLAKYLEDESTTKDLAQALKIAVNSVWGTTAPKFDNPLRDLRDNDDIYIC